VETVCVCPSEWSDSDNFMNTKVVNE